MMYVIGVIAVLWFICFFVDTWQASKKTLHYDNHLPLGTYRVGLRWDDTIKDYRATAQIATWVLHR